MSSLAVRYVNTTAVAVVVVAVVTSEIGGRELGCSGAVTLYIKA